MQKAKSSGNCVDIPEPIGGDCLQAEPGSEQRSREGGDAIAVAVRIRAFEQCSTDARAAELDTVLANLVRTVARLAGLAAPFMPEKAAQIWRLLGNEPPFERLAWSDLDAPELQGRRVEKPPVLFPKPAPV